MICTCICRFTCRLRIHGNVNGCPALAIAGFQMGGVSQKGRRPVYTCTCMVYMYMYRYYACVHVHIYIYIYTYICNMYIHIYIYIYMCYASVYVYAYVHLLKFVIPVFAAE